MSPSAGTQPKENSQTWWGRTVIGSALALGAGWYVLEHPEWGTWTVWAQPAMYGIGGLLLLTVLIVMTTSTRTTQRSRLADSLRAKLGHEWTPTADTFRTGRIRDGVPQKVWVDYPNTAPDHDPRWRADIEHIISERMGTQRRCWKRTSPRFPWLGRSTVKLKLTSAWDRKNGTVRFTNKPIRRTPETVVEEQQQQVVERITRILKPSFGVGITVSVTEWETTS